MNRTARPTSTHAVSHVPLRRLVAALLPAVLLLSLLTTVMEARSEEQPLRTLADKESRESADAAAPNAMDSMTVMMLDGTEHPWTDYQKKNGTVVVFLFTECPIANAYLHRLNELADLCKSADVGFVGVYSNDSDTLVKAVRHRKEYQLHFPTVTDPHARLAKSLHATHTPEAVVLGPDGKTVYQGRIDDRFAKRGGSRRPVVQEDLHDALDSLIRHQPIAVAKTEPVGCPILADEVGESSAPTDNSVTYSREVAPILNRSCVQCHREGGAAPFSLTSYEPAKNWGADLLSVIESGQMPPWKMVDGHGDFHNRREVSAADQEMLAHWIKAGCPEGNPADAPPVPQFADGWQLGTPDFIVKSSEKFTLAADGEDEYRCFVFPTHFSENKLVKGIEVLAGNKRIVHHVLVFLDTSDRSTQLDAADPLPGYQTAAGPPGFLPAGGLGGWAPGNEAHLAPLGMARVLPPGAKIVMQVHYNRTGKEEVDDTTLGLHFADEPITRAIGSLPILPIYGPLGGLRIPAGEANHTMTATQTLHSDEFVLAATPHMHLLGKEMKLDAELPDGSVIPMLWLRNWDFNWQQTYQYREPVALPKGTKLNLSITWDNSPDNPNNPKRPPELVRWGEQTTDEMGICFLEIASQQEVTDPTQLKARDPSRLRREFWTRAATDWLSRDTSSAK